MPLDQRLLRVGIETDGELRFYDELAITVTGQKFASPTQDECSISIANLSKDVRDFILTETSPFNQNRTRKSVIVEAGRESYGTSVLYVGDISRSSVSQAPDNILTLKCLTGNFNKGRILAVSGTQSERLSVLAGRVADVNELDLRFEATDKQVANYSYTGSAIKQINELSAAANSDIYIDGNELVVKDFDQPLAGATISVSKDQGLVGIPQLTEQGVRVNFFYTPAARLGGMLELESEQYPAASGRYVIYKLKFNLTNRDTPFYYTAEAIRA